MERLSFLSHRHALYFYAALLLVLIGLMTLTPRDAATEVSVTEGPLTGWLWSATVGWISLNCADINVCDTSDYKVERAQDGELSGYAWSDTLGWITFNINESSGCPQTQIGNTLCTPSIINGIVSGWVRACSGMDNLSLNQTEPNNACSNSADVAAGETGRTDGWDGWISLRGTSPQAYGPVVDDEDGSVTGFGWGNEVVGWTSFAASTTVMCVADETPTCQVDDDGNERSCTFYIDSCAYDCETTEVEPCAVGCNENTGVCI